MIGLSQTGSGSLFSVHTSEILYTGISVEVAEVTRVSC